MKEVTLLAIAIVMVGSPEVMAQANLTACTYNVKSFEIENQALSGGTAFQMPLFYKAIKELGADIYAINELGILTSRTGERHLLSDLAGELDMYSTFGLSYTKDVGMYGNGLISKFHILSVNSKSLPKPTDSADTRSVMWGEQDGETLVIVTADHETGGLTLVGGSSKRGTAVGHFSTDGHSGVMVPVYAYGAGVIQLTGIYQNTELHHKICNALNFK